MSDLPEVYDEASPTPTWIPIIGVLILVAMSLVALVHGAMPQPSADAHVVDVAPDDAPSE